MKIRIGLVVVLAAFALTALALTSLPGMAQDLQSLAKERIAAETGLDEDLLATIFVSEENAQFILTFIYINDRTFDSKLKPELKQAIEPYRNRDAMLVLVTPAIDSYFNPLAIAFFQDRVTYRVRSSCIRRIDPEFAVGTVPSGRVTAGIILLDQLAVSGSSAFATPAPQLDTRRPFTITYIGRYSTNFALQSEATEGIELGLAVNPIGASNPLELIWLALLNLFLLLLLAFLLGV